MNKLLKKRVILYFLIGLVVIGIFGINVSSRINSVDYHLSQGQKYLTELNYEKAMVSFEKAIEIDSKSVEAYLGIADAYIGLEEYQLAEDYINKGLESLIYEDRLAEKLDQIYEITSSQTDIDEIIEESHQESLIEDEDLTSEVIKTLFINEYNINISEYEELDRKVNDLDGDGLEEVILLLGKGERFFLDECYLVVMNDDESEILTTFEAGLMDIYIDNIVDINGDGINDITIGWSSGGSAGGGTYEVVYNKGVYQQLEYDSNTREVETGFLDDYRYYFKIVSDSGVKEQVIRLLTPEIEELKSSNIYNDYGDLLYQGSQIMHDFGTSFVDIDNDGQNEIISSRTISVTCNACTAVVENLVYKYKDGVMELYDFYIYSGSEMDSFSHNYLKYKEVQEAKQELYDRFSTDESQLQLRYIDNPITINDLNYDLSDDYYVFEVTVDPLTNAFNTFDEYLLLNKNDQNIEYLDANGQINITNY